MTMWTRAELKTRAKLSLKGTYWTAFGAALVPALIASAPIGVLYGIVAVSTVLMGVAAGSSKVAMTTGMVVLMAVFLVIVLASIFLLMLPMEAGITNYFNRAAMRRGRFQDVFYSFRDGHYPAVTGTLALQAVKVFLWSLLLFVPGIIKSYAYLMVPYILSDNPEIGARRALELSQAMMRGQKWRAFVLGLSFLGWALLGMLACEIGVYFLAPYIQATFAELYQKLRADAVYDGLTSLEELRLAPSPAQPVSPSC